MNFSLEVGPHTDLDTLPPVKDVYITMLPGGDYKETAEKADNLVKQGFNPVPHFPARSINDEAQLKDYITRCKDVGTKQALVIGGSRDPIGKFDSSIQILETGYFDGIKIGKASAVLAASLFHFKEITISEVKNYLKSKNINVRIDNLGMKK